jgi:probable rRNA maturation factor
MTEGALETSVNVDEQVAMPHGYSPGDVERVVEAALRAEGASGPWEISIVFADDDELRRLHREYLGDDTPTDIMTFPNESGDGDWFGDESGSVGGDIAISVDRAREQCADEGWDACRELLFLVAHGVLHLLGWDDATAESRAAMLDRQREILRQLDLA